MRQEKISDAVSCIHDKYILEAACFSAGNAGKDTHMENKHKKTNLRKIARTGLIAAALMCLLTVTAFASGYAQSLIAKMSGFYAVPDPDRDTAYMEAGEISDKEEKSGRLIQFNDRAITIHESYYDGEKLILVYSIEDARYPADFSFGPGSENFDKLEKLDPNYSFLTHDLLTEEEWEHFAEEFKENGRVGFIVHSFWLSDHIRLSDGTDIGPMTGHEVDGKIYLETQNGLLEEARNRDELELVLTVKSSTSYFYYIDEDDMYRYYSPGDAEEVTFTIPNCK